MSDATDGQASATAPFSECLINGLNSVIGMRQQTLLVCKLLQGTLVGSLLLYNEA